MSFWDIIRDWKEIFEDGEYGYDWSLFRVWKKGRVYYWMSDAGCSCNDFGDGVTSESEFCSGTRMEEVIAGYREWHSSHSYSQFADEITGVEKLREALRSS